MEIEDKIQLVRGILESDQFQNQPKQQQRITIDNIIATGEVSKDEVEQLYRKVNASMLEKLPYDLFIRFVVESDMEPDDVISLCSSSPLLNDYCNKGLTLHNGDVASKYLFRILLEKDRPGILIEGDPKELYANLVVKADSNYYGLIDLLDSIRNMGWTLLRAEILNDPKIKPITLEDLLYTTHQDQYGLLSWLKIDPEQSYFTQNDLNLIQDSIYLIHGIIDYFRDEPIRHDLDTAWRLRGNPIEILRLIESQDIDVNMILTDIRQNGTINYPLASLSKFFHKSNNDLITIIKNYNIYYRNILNACLPIDYQSLKTGILLELKYIVQHYLDAIDTDNIDSDDEDEINDKFIDDTQTLLVEIEEGYYDYDIDYAILQHYKVLAGKAKVTDLF
jgi:hypothetical protein